MRIELRRASVVGALTFLAAALPLHRARALDLTPASDAREQHDTLTGRVLDAKGAPLADVVVAIAELHRGTVTGADGAFRFTELPAGHYTVIARRLGFATVAQSVDVPQREAITFGMEESAVAIEPVSVTATRTPTSALSSPIPTASLSEEALRREQSISLAHALRSLPGVQAVTTGEQIGKPMIRGLFGPRVLVASDGSRIEDYSWSEEDAPSIDARLAERVEVIRGPASVLYGSDAIGGVVNVLPAALPFSADGSASWRKQFELYGESNNVGLGGTLSLEGARGGMAWRLAGVGRYAGSYDTPEGEVENTGFMSANGEGALGFRNDRGTTTLRFAHYGGEFKLLEANPPANQQPGAKDAGPERKLIDDRLQFSNERLFGSVRLETRAQWQRHWLEEVSDDAASLGIPATIPGQQEQPSFELVLNTGTADVIAHHQVGNHVQGSVGLSGMYQANDSRGPIWLVPDATIGSGAAFAFEQATFGRLTLLAGGRGDRRSQHATPNRGVVDSTGGGERDYTAWTGDLGAVFRPVEHMAVAVNFGTAWRAPTLFELYANGPHLAEERFEQGDSTLSPEQSRNLDASVRWQSDRFSAEIAAFRNAIDGYMYPERTNQFHGSYRVYQWTATNALLTGGELSASARVLPALTLGLKHDLVRGDDRVAGAPLALVPPPRTSVSLDLRGLGSRLGRRSHALVEVEHVNAATRVNASDIPTGAYTLVNLDLGTVRTIAGREANIGLGVRNIGNVAYRSFLSRYKEFALDPGRNVVLRVSIQD